MNPETRLFIDGELCDAASGKTYPNINPATEEVMGRSEGLGDRGAGLPGPQAGGAEDHDLVGVEQSQGRRCGVAVAVGRAGRDDRRARI